MPMHYHVEKISSFSMLEEMREVWEDVLFSSEEDEVFLTFDWMKSWWEVYGQDRKLLVLLVKEGNEAVAIAPFTTSTIGKVMRFEILEFIGTGTSDRLAVFCNRGKEDALDSVWNYLVHHKGWDRLDLKDMKAWAPCSKSFMKAFPEAKVEESSSPYLPLKGTFQTYLSSLSSNVRHNMARSNRRMRESFNAEFRAFRDPEDADFCFDTLIQLNAMRWKEMGTTTLSSERMRSFLKRAVRAQMEKGRVTYHMLLSNGKPFSVTLGFEYGGRYLFYLSGFDPEFDSVGPGRSLLAKLIEESYSRGLKEVDFLRGGEEYKYRFNPLDRKLIRGEVRRGTLKGEIVDRLRK